MAMAAATAARAPHGVRARAMRPPAPAGACLAGPLGLGGRLPIPPGSLAPQKLRLPSARCNCARRGNRCSCTRMRAEGPVAFANLFRKGWASPGSGRDGFAFWPKPEAGSGVASLTGSALANGGGGGGTGSTGGSGGGGGGGGGDVGLNQIASAHHQLQDSDGECDAPVQEIGGEEVLLLDVSGMMCGGCAASVKRVLEQQPTVVSATVNLATETALVKVDMEQVLALLGAGSGGAAEDVEAGGAGGGAAALLEERGRQLAYVLTDKGFDTAIRSEDSAAAAGAMLRSKREERMQRLRAATGRLAVAWSLAAACIAGHIAHMVPNAPVWVHALCSTRVHAGLSLFALLGPGRQILTDGWVSLARNAPNMNTLVALGSCASFGVSAAAVLLPKLGWTAFFEEPVMLLAFVLLGRAVEERAKLKAGSDMEAMLNLLPPQARLVLRDGSSAKGAPPRTRPVPTEAVGAGDFVLVLPGDRIPVDGVVCYGRTTVDESSLTGEPLPSTKEAGSTVSAGTVNCNGAITVEATRPGGDTALADIVRIVETAQARSAPVQRLADEVSGKFVYGVMAASAATFAFWRTVGAAAFPAAVAAAGASSSTMLAVQLACNVLVVACPCALGLATPTAVLVGTGLGARKGLLIRGGDVLETAYGADVVVFDKTGTLTAGKPAVGRVLPAEARRMGVNEILSLAAGVERGASHPIAAAVASAAALAGVRELGAAAGTFEQEPGSGARGTVAGRAVAVGTLAYVTRYGAKGGLPDWDTAVAVAAPGGGSGAMARVDAGSTRIFVGVDGRLVGAMEVADEIREDAASTVAELKARGLRPILLSGDAEGPAHAVAAAVGIPPGDVFYGVRPEEKASKVESLQLEGRKVVMVGDGVNDAGALAQADVGVAMGGGVGAAAECASIVLMGDRVGQVLEAVDLSRATFRKIRQNLMWAFGYNLIGIPLAAGALLPGWGVALTPSVAGALMGGSSLGVMTNSLLLQLECRDIGKGKGAGKGKAKGEGGAVTIIELGSAAPV